jgi:hypothetical protein
MPGHRCDANYRSAAAQVQGPQERLPGGIQAVRRGPVALGAENAPDGASLKFAVASDFAPVASAAAHAPGMLAP